MRFEAPYSFVGGHVPAHLHSEHLADLRASGLTDETIRASGVYSLAPRWMKQFFKKKKGRPVVPANLETALCFPYQGGTFARIKLFPPLGKMKYAQPPETSARLYLPFQVNDGSVFVCEGEKKTLAAWQRGLNAVGIGGVWSWIARGEPIDDLKLVEWDTRNVVIVPDSDIFQRYDLLCAIYALGRELRNQGAVVCIAQIPQGAEPKIGLDDYFMAGGDVNELETFTLDQRVFRSASFWYGKWKMKAALAA